MPSKSPRILLLLDDELLRRIEDYRRRQEIIPSRNQALRQLIEEALAAHEKPATKKGSRCKKGS